jgi:hypothetical protein
MCGTLPFSCAPLLNVCEDWLNHFMSYRLMCAALMVLLQGLLFLVVHQLVGYFLINDHFCSHN